MTIMVTVELLIYFKKML